MTDLATLTAQIEERMGNGEPFTFAGMYAKYATDDECARMMSNAMAYWARHGWITHIGSDRWALTDAGREAVKARAGG